MCVGFCSRDAITSPKSQRFERSSVPSDRSKKLTRNRAAQTCKVVKKPAAGAEATTINPDPRTVAGSADTDGREIRTNNEHENKKEW